MFWKNTNKSARIEELEKKNEMLKKQLEMKTISARECIDKIDRATERLDKYEKGRSEKL